MDMGEITIIYPTKSPMLTSRAAADALADRALYRVSIEGIGSTMHDAQIEMREKIKQIEMTLGPGYQFRRGDSMNEVDECNWYYVMSAFHVAIYLKTPEQITILGLLL